MTATVIKVATHRRAPAGAELAKLHCQPPGAVAPVVSLTDYAKLAEVAC